jgi:hypothetical protein
VGFRKHPHHGRRANLDNEGESVMFEVDLRNVAQTFQRFLDQVLHGLNFVYTYVNDILIASENMQQHLEHVESDLNGLSQHGIVINHKKCTFGAQELKFLVFQKRLKDYRGF